MYQKLPSSSHINTCSSTSSRNTVPSHLRAPCPQGHPPLSALGAIPLLPRPKDTSCHLPTTCQPRGKSVAPHTHGAPIHYVTVGPSAHVSLYVYAYAWYGSSKPPQFAKRRQPHPKGGQLTTQVAKPPPHSCFLLGCTCSYTLKGSFLTAPCEGRLSQQQTPLQLPSFPLPPRSTRARRKGSR